MKNLNNIPPVIIIGMHRSGTGLLTKLLSEAGVFFGGVQEQNGESVLFLKLNQRILKMSGSTWSDPYLYDINLPEQREKVLKFAGSAVKNFFSENEYWRNFTENKFRCWGWKDPRNTLTLDIWKKFFPEPKIIHLYRNPVDVAASLKNREESFEKIGKIRWKYAVLRNYFKLGVIAKRDPALLDIARGVELWEFYVRRAFAFDDDIVHIKYEDLLENPVAVLTTVFDFISIEKSPSEVAKIAGGINKKRRYAFLNDPELIGIYKKVKDDEFIKSLGYSKIL